MPLRSSFRFSQLLLSKLTLSQKISLVGLFLGAMLFIYSFSTVLNGTHQHRQADSAFVGYFFCKENVNFLHPRIAPRGLTEGTAINEFPVYGFVLGQICKAKNSWDEVTPKLLSLLMAIFSAILFWQILRLKYTVPSDSFLEFLVLFLFVPVNLTFFTIPMPESTGLFFYALAGWLWAKYPLNNVKVFSSGLYLLVLKELPQPTKNIPFNILACLCFTLGFLIRPYYFLLLLFFLPGLLQTIILFFSSVFLFWFWYRYWNSMVTTVHGYFGIQFQTWYEIKENLPIALAHLPVRISEHTSIVGLWLMYLARSKYRYLIGLYILNFLVMYTLKSTHVSAHGYYLLNAGIIAIIVIFLQYAQSPQKIRNWFLAIFLIYSLISYQHQFHKNKNFSKTMSALKNFGILPDNARVVTYMGLDPQWLYYLKRIGFEALEDDVNSPCPEGASHFLRWSHSHDSDVIIGDCKSKTSN